MVTGGAVAHVLQQGWQIHGLQSVCEWIGLGHHQGECFRLVLWTCCEALEFVFSRLDVQRLIFAFEMAAYEPISRQPARLMLRHQPRQSAPTPGHLRDTLGYESNLVQQCHLKCVCCPESCGCESFSEELSMFVHWACAQVVVEGIVFVLMPI